MKRKSGLEKSIRWEHLPHDALFLEVRSRIARRDSSTADREVRVQYLSEQLKILDLEVHDEYINHVAAELKRELRICRDVYCEYLATINKRSMTAKARVALDYATAPLASRRLREEVLFYLRQVGMTDVMFSVLFYRLFSLMVNHPNFGEDWIRMENVVDSLISERCFQELKNATPRQIDALVRGPFGNPVEPFQSLVFVFPSDIEERPNSIWDHRNMLVGYELWRLWDFVFREICDQHAAIDCEEKSVLAQALIELDVFERTAGRMFYEASQNAMSHIPDHLFLKMGEQLDKQGIGITDHLGTRGEEILKQMGRQGQPIRSWAEALSDKRERKFLPAKATNRSEATTLKNFGTLSRAAKRAFYRAKDSYQAALDKVYDRRVQPSIHHNPFQP